MFLFFVTQVDTDSWQQTFLYVTLASVAFINVNAAIFQVCTVQTFLNFLSASIIFSGWNSGCRWQVPSCLHGGSLCRTGLQKPLVPSVILGISCRQLVASLPAGPTWWCWQWVLRPRTLPSFALLSGDASSYYYPCGKT